MRISFFTSCMCIVLVAFFGMQACGIEIEVQQFVATFRNTTNQPANDFHAYLYDITDSSKVGFCNSNNPEFPHVDISEFSFGTKVVWYGAAVADNDTGTFGLTIKQSSGFNGRTYTFWSLNGEETGIAVSLIPNYTIPEPDIVRNISKNTCGVPFWVQRLHGTSAQIFDLVDLKPGGIIWETLEELDPIEPLIIQPDEILTNDFDYVLGQLTYLVGYRLYKDNDGEPGDLVCESLSAATIPEPATVLLLSLGGLLLRRRK